MKRVPSSRIFFFTYFLWVQVKCCRLNDVCAERNAGSPTHQSLAEVSHQLRLRNYSTVDNYVKIGASTVGRLSGLAFRCPAFTQRPDMVAHFCDPSARQEEGCGEEGQGVRVGGERQEDPRGSLDSYLARIEHFRFSEKPCLKNKVQK